MRNVLYKINRYKLAICDFIIVILSYILSKLYIADSKTFIESFTTDYVQKLLIIGGIYVVLYVIGNIYNIIWGYAKSKTYIYYAFLSLGGNVLINFVNFFMYGREYFSVYIIKVNTLACLFIIAMTEALRVIVKLYNRSKSEKKIYEKIGNDYRERKNLLIFGAGESTGILLPEIMHQNRYNIVGIIDDNMKKQGCTIFGHKVIGNSQKIVSICEEKNVDEIIISAPSMSRKRRSEIIDICAKTSARIRIVPQIYTVINSKGGLISNVRDIQIEDILSRNPIKLENDLIGEILKNKTILVTGGGGSIGSELCRQIGKYEIEKLIIVDIYENNAYDIQNELKSLYKDLDLEVIIADVADKTQMESIFKENKIEIVFHAAAHKHVPLMESDAIRAIKNNVYGTMNVVNLASKYNSEKFILVSTDKAVNPTNVMGATKRICEMIVQAKNKVSNTDYLAVRFGNVLGSNGSVIPLFKKQIEKGGPITVTSTDIIRYFMTIPEAVSLILQATSYAKGGEIFILDMGNPVKIYDMARKMIELAGLEPDKDIEIKVTGLRPGEKMYEELLTDVEKTKTDNPKIFVAKPEEFDYNDLVEQIEDIPLDYKASNLDIKKKMKEIVKEYKVYEGK